MSGWLIGLALGAGYLVNKNMAFKGQLDASVAKFQSAVNPATDGVTSAEVRSAHKRTDHVKYGDMNSDISTLQKERLEKNQTLAASEVEAFEMGSEPIVGVLMQFDKLGV